ncbi:hypothetical protein HZC32_01725 [Candidatus Woesearchaeota archaeon]|nr:hypothetical protein [Candidatus Woesearchaeota archaeon]
MDHLEEDRTKELVKKLILKIKQKRELKWISDAVVNEKLFEYLKQKPKLNLENKCSADYRQVIKEIRAKLRSAYGLFREEKVEVGNFKNIKEILTRHSSTKERVEFYPRLYQKLFKITGKVSSILDLGCGINPFSIEFMGLNRLNYYAYDINEKEINLLNRYFSRKNQENKAFRGQAEVY